MTRLPFFGYRIVSAILSVIFGMLEHINNEATLYILLALLPIILWVDFYSDIKRLHDVDKSGWWALIMLIPLVNLCLGIYLLFAKGTEGSNRFGEAVIS